MNTREMWSYDVTLQRHIRPIVTDQVAILVHTRCALKRGYSECRPYCAHVIVAHPDGTMDWLCRGNVVSTTPSTGWWIRNADVLAILQESLHTKPLGKRGWRAVAKGTFIAAGHRFCTRCELMLDNMNRDMQESAQPS